MSSSPTDSDWRSSVRQSFRNAQARDVAKVLAGLEPGASEASKLRLAMQFEDSIFRVAESLPDYHKRMSKRLKKLQKNYKPTVDARSQTDERQRNIQELINKYGHDLQYVLKHSETAIREMKHKHGEDRSKQLQQHIEHAKLWAKDLGLTTNNNNNNNSPNGNMSHAHLEKLQSHLKINLPNIRSHIVKLAQPDRFLLETFFKVQEGDFADNREAVRVQSEVMKVVYGQLQKKTNVAENNTTVDLTSALEGTYRAVPNLPSRSTLQDNNNKTNTMDPNKIKIAVAHLDKMRSAATVLLGYLLAPDKHQVPAKTFSKTDQVVVNGIAVVQETLREHRAVYSQSDNNNQRLQLQDAWLKEIVLPVKQQQAPQPPPPVVQPQWKSKLLLTKGRGTPSNVSVALQSLNVKVVRPPGNASHIILSLGAFDMIVYMVPLLVEFRATDAAATCTTLPNLASVVVEEPPPHAPDNEQPPQCASWIPLHRGLLSTQHHLPIMAVQEQLRDAGARATQVLRLCFANHTTQVCGDVFEMELLEASALLEFVHAARDAFAVHG